MDHQQKVLIEAQLEVHHLEAPHLEVLLQDLHIDRAQKNQVQGDLQKEEAIRL